MKFTVLIDARRVTSMHAAVLNESNHLGEWFRTVRFKYMIYEVLGAWRKISQTRGPEQLQLPGAS
jgi:hypothetical protein